MNPELKKLLDEGNKKVKKLIGREFLPIGEYEKKYGIPGYIPFGLPDLDMLCGNDGPKLNYGIPRGRVTELQGAESSFKSTLVHHLAAEVINQGGIVRWFSSETDFNERYAMQHLKEIVVDPSRVENEYYYQAIPVMTVQELFKAMKGVMDPLTKRANEIEKEGGYPHRDELFRPPILFVLDSLSAMLGGDDYSRLEAVTEKKDGGAKVGGHAAEMHRFFKFFLVPWMQVGAAFVYTNHLRANINTAGPYGPKTKAAHDIVVRHYCQLRINVKSWNWNPGTSKPTRAGLQFQYGKRIKASVYKERNDQFVLDGTTELVYQHNHGFDLFRSVIYMLVQTGVIELKSKAKDAKIDANEYIIAIDDDPVLAELNGTYKMKALKMLLAEDPGRLPEYIQRAMKRGAVTLEDMRRASK